jgi:sialate O-acetylesterase
MKLAMFRMGGRTAMLSFLSGVLCLALSAGESGLSLSSMFADNAVFQRGIPVPVWGGATPGAKVSLTFNGQTSALGRK